MVEEDWENVVIETGVDTLLNYLAENQEATVSEISEDLGVEEDRIKRWAKALADNDFVEKSYSARKGMVLKYTKQNKEVAEGRLEQLRQEVEQEAESVEKELKSREDEIEKAKKQLQQMTDELEDNRKKEEEIKNNLEKLEELEEELEQKLEKQAQKEEKLHSRSVELLSKIDSALENIDEAEEKAGEFGEKKTEIRKKVKALKKLEKHAETAEEVEDRLEDLEAGRKEAGGIFRSFRKKIGSIFGGPAHEDVLDGTVEDAKDGIADMESPDYGRLIELEKSGKNRETLLNWLESRQNE